LIGKAKASHDSSRVGLDVANRWVLGLNQSLSVGQQHGAERRQAHLSCVSFKELKAELTLERLDPLREGRLREMKVLGGLSEMT